MVAWSRLLDRAQADLNRRAFRDAHRQAEGLLQAPLPRDLRGRVLIVAADAAYGMGAYSAAARHYGEFVAGHTNAPEAARAAMALGWARLRSGDRQGARAAWNGLADSRPDDGRTPMALALAAELASQTGDTAGAERLLDRLVTQYSSSGPAGAGRLSRASARLKRTQDAAALRELDDVMRVDGSWIVDERRKISQALVGGDDTIWIFTRTASALRQESGEPLDRFAARLLDPQYHEMSPYLLHGIVLLAAQRGWANSLTAALASRLVEDFPSYAPGPKLLVRVAEAAAGSGQWPLARQSWETLLAHAPGAMGRGERLMLAQAQLLTGNTVQARKGLEELVASGREEAPRALLMLANIHIAAGDHRAALAALDRLQKDFPRFPRSARSLLMHAQLLEELGQSGRARLVLKKAVEIVERGEGDVLAEAAYRLGQGWSAEGKHAAAVEWYLTAAYTAERSAWGRKALLGAGHSLAALNEKKEALAAYRKLISARPGLQQSEDHEVSGEAAYRAAEILHNVNRHAEALEMFKTSARLTAGLPTERRALLGALQCVAAAGDRKTAEVFYQRLQQIGATEAQLALARQALQANGRATSPSQSPLPTPAR
jgi:tetratricopeptide (TPR) repeat protein